MLMFSSTRIHLAVLSIAALFALPSASAQIQINELLAVNSTIASDPDFGEFSDYAELINNTAVPIDLGGYTLSDDPAETDKWALPALTLQPGELLLVWTDGQDKRPGDTAFVAYKNATATMSALHAGFRLSGDGEYLGLYNPQGNLMDEITYCVQAGDVSYGRSTANPSQWIYFGEPTPGAANSPFGSASMETPGTPVFSLAEGFYDTPQMLHLSTQEPGAVIRYTFDGTTPNAASPVFSTDIPISLNLSIKARLYVPGKMPGKVITKSFFINENKQMPVLSITSNAANLYGFDFGILQNAIKDREVPATIEYFEPGTGERAFLSGVGLRVFGSSIYNLPQRPISVRFKEKYGDEVLKYPLFEGKSIPRYTSFLLRNGGNDFNTAYFRDGLGVHLVKGKMDIDYQDYKPCIVFINGAYNGIYELRERLDEQYISSNHEINADNLDYLEDSLQVVAGDAYDFEDLMHFVQQHDLSDSATFARVAARIDLSELSNYLILRSFIGYQIADLNNHYWRNRDNQGKWRWVAADLEHAFGQLGGDPYTDNTIAKLAGIAGNLPDWSTLMFKRLLQNPGFRDEFIQRSAAYLNTIFQPSSTLQTVDSLKNLLQPQMPRHIGCWHSPPSMAVWQGNVGMLKTFLQNRPAFYRQHLSNLFGKQDSAQVSLHIVGQGKVLLSGVAFSENMQGPFFKNTHIKLQALPAPGHRFVGWQGVSGNGEYADLTPVGDTAFTAIFEQIPNISIIPPLISADTTLAAAASPWFGFDDVTVLPGARLRVEAGATLLLSDGVCLDVQGGLRLEGTASQHVRIQPDPLPSARRSYYGQSGFWGSIQAEEPTDSVVIRYADLRGGSFGRDRSRHFSTISAYDCPLWVEHSTISEGKAPLIARGGSAYIGYSEFHTFVSCNGFVSLYDMDAPLIEHCVFAGNRAINTDGIDIKGVTNGIVRQNHVYGFLGSNCDAIDLGIYTENCLVEQNIVHDCSDKGISIGSQSDALVRRNVIYDCDLGVAVKDSLAVAHIDQNTFYGNRQAVSCYEKSALRGGGKAFVKNTILSTSTEASVYFDAKSSVETSYSLSDREVLPGTGNLHTDPALVFPSAGNFELAPGSPCIDSGDQSSPDDPDGSQADMGAYYTHSGASALTLHINEFQYHPPFNYPTGDWVELYNRTELPIDLTGWRMAQGLNELVFPENTTVQPGAYLVVCQDTAQFRLFYAHSAPLAGNFHFDLDNKAGKIALYDSSGTLVHSARYADTRPWPPLADGLGATVELEQNAAGNLPTDWRESHVLLGTPGLPNSLPPDVSALFVNEILASNTQSLPDEQGAYDDWFELYNASDDSLNVGGLCFTDNVTEPCRWQAPMHFPDLTTLPPHGFLLLWADGQPGQGPLHADFKLSAAGETVAIFQRSGFGYAEQERLNFGPQTPDISRGRYPDGSADIRFMLPTPGATNVASGTAEPPPLPLELYPNPFSEWLFVSTETVEKPYRLTLLNAQGQVVYRAEGLRDEQARIHRGGLPAGVYWVVVLDGKGRRYGGKVEAD
ncbi:MAG: CotH kinase family protein [Bacteroidetes bacterium]|nr:CotH kinase family protein [Bacteroidota bacterium]